MTAPAPLCANMDPRIWDTDHLTGTEREDAEQYAIALCHQCPVRQQCLEDALTEEGNKPTTDRATIRGGHTPAQRARIGGGRGAANRDCANCGNAIPEQRRRANAKYCRNECTAEAKRLRRAPAERRAKPASARQLPAQEGSRMTTTAAPWTGLRWTARRVLETIHRCPACGQWICAQKWQTRPHDCAGKDEE